MPVQVAGYCYATNADAAPAACAGFASLSQLMPDGQTVKTVSCTGTNSETGALLITVTTLPPAGPQSAIVLEQTPNFPPCIESDKVEATMAITSALMALAGACIPFYFLIRWLNTNTKAQT